MDQHPGPLHVTQEMEPQPLVLVRPLDQARDVGDDDLLIIDGQDPQVRGKSREGIPRDLRPRATDRRKEARLPRVGEPHQSDVGNKLQLQGQGPFLAHVALLRETRRPAHRTGKMRVTPPPAAAPGGDEGLARLDEIGKDVPRLVSDQGPAGQGDAQVLAVRTGPHRPTAVPRMASLEAAIELEVGQGDDPPHRLENNASALSAVRAVGAALGDELFPAKAEGPIPSAPRLDHYPGQIDELHGQHPHSKKQKKRGPRQTEPPSQDEKIRESIWKPI